VIMCTVGLSCSYVPNGLKMAGTNSTTSADTYVYWDQVAGNSISPVKVPYFILQDTNANQSGDYILNQRPSNGTTTSSNLVDFTYEYNSQSQPYTFKGIRLTDTTGGQSIAVPEQAIITSGVGTFSYTAILTVAHRYTYTPYLRTSDGQYLYGTSYGFTVIRNPLLSIATSSNATSSNPFSFGIFSNSTSSPTGLVDSSLDAFNTCGAFGSLFTLGLCPIFVFLFTPNATSFNGFADVGQALEGKVPFSYFFQVVNDFNNITLSDDASSSPEISIGFASMTCSGAWQGSGLASCDPKLKDWLPTSMVLFSTTSMAYYVPYSVVSFGRSAVEIALYFAFGMYVFYRVRGFVAEGRREPTTFFM